MTHVSPPLKYHHEALLICGFPGVGKSHLTQAVYESRDDRVITDSDSSLFPKDAFPQNYIAHLGNLIRVANESWRTHYILCSTHAIVLKEFAAKQWRHYVVFPERGLKEEYLQRYRDRGSPEAFISLLNNKWDSFMDDLEAHVASNSEYAIPVRLTSGQYLSSVNLTPAGEDIKRDYSNTWEN